MSPPDLAIVTPAPPTRPIAELASQALARRTVVVERAIRRGAVVGLLLEHARFGALVVSDPDPRADATAYGLTRDNGLFLNIHPAAGQCLPQPWMPTAVMMVGGPEHIAVAHPVFLASADASLALPQHTHTLFAALGSVGSQAHAALAAAACRHEAWLQASRDVPAHAESLARCLVAISRVYLRQARFGDDTLLSPLNLHQQQLAQLASLSEVARSGRLAQVPGAAREARRHLRQLGGALNGAGPPQVYNSLDRSEPFYAAAVAALGAIEPSSQARCFEHRHPCRPCGRPWEWAPSTTLLDWDPPIEAAVQPDEHPWPVDDEDDFLL